MSFVNEPFPLEVAKGTRGGPVMSLAVHEGDGGSQERSRRWPTYRWEYDAGIGIRKLSQLDLLRTHTLAIGQENSFPFLDVDDFSSAADTRSNPSLVHPLDQVIGVGDGSTTLFQLIKTYTLGARTYVRTIRKPIIGSVTIGNATVSSTVSVSVDSTVKTLNTHYTVDTSTGQVQFLAGQTPGNGAIVRASYRHYVPVFYGKDFKYKASRDALDGGRVLEVPLVEDVGLGAITPDFLYLGSGDTISLTSSRLYDWSWGQMVFLVPNADGYVVTLPDITDLPFGGPILTFANSALAGPRTITFKNRATGATEFTLPILQDATLYVRKDSGNRVWAAH